MKTSTMGLKSTRIESTATAGVPDLCICDKSGHFHFIELKVITANKVGLRPHQISWLTRHSHASAWILIRKQKNTETPAELFLYKAEDAIELAEVGVKLEPHVHQLSPFHLDKVFQAITDNP